MKNTFKILFILIAIPFQFDCFGQTGRLEVNFVDYYFYNEDPMVTVLIFQDNKLKAKFEDYLYNLDTYEIDTALKVGFYDIKFYMHHKDSLTQEVKNIEIQEGESTYVTFYLPEVTDSRYNAYDDPMISMNYSNGSNFVNNNPIFDCYNEFAYKIGSIYPLSKHFLFGFQFGTSINNTHFNKNHSISPTLDLDKEKYFYWSLNNQVFTRISSYNSKTAIGFGLFMDLGASYNFPLMYRYTIKEGKSKTSIKGIHRYNDFSTFARIGFEPISLICEYRLTNFLKEIYPEQPKIKIGISLRVQHGRY